MNPDVKAHPIARRLVIIIVIIAMVMVIIIPAVVPVVEMPLRRYHNYRLGVIVMTMMIVKPAMVVIGHRYPRHRQKQKPQKTVK